MCGIGRRISISTFGIGVILEGGIIKDKELDGFARYLRVPNTIKDFNIISAGGEMVGSVDMDEESIRVSCKKTQIKMENT